MKFRKKPVEIEAFRMGVDRRPDWFQDKVSSGEITTHYVSKRDRKDQTINETYCKIETLEGIMVGNYGDWIIQGVNGEIYPCKPDIFEKTYEPVPSSSVEHEIEEEELKWHD